MNKLQERVESLEFENKQLNDSLERKRKEYDVIKQRVLNNEGISKMALAQSNMNEQYSRKTNIKILGVSEQKAENTKEVVKGLIKDKAGVEIADDEIIAVHRIPGKKDHHRPIILKLKNTESKAAVMRKRKDVKNSGGNVRIADDVTWLNTELISRLLKHEQITSAWYFNSHVYGQYGNTRIQFDIFDDINEKLLKAVRVSK